MDTATDTNDMINAILTTDWLNFDVIHAPAGCQKLSDIKISKENLEVSL